tara:strand:+ start:187 stop:591 length:405 start_codon:yes stop_codon:yes gene_type:complete
MNWKPSPKSKFPGIGKKRGNFNLKEESCRKLALKKSETRKAQGEIIDELIERFIDEIMPIEIQYVGAGYIKQNLERLGDKCQKCGISCGDARLEVDHIKPMSLFPELEQDQNNLQILCMRCNRRKSNKYIRDYR